MTLITRLRTERDEARELAAEPRCAEAAAELLDMAQLLEEAASALESMQELFRMASQPFGQPEQVRGSWVEYRDTLLNRE